ncbi:MAG: hypothetical protein J3K34DRAFT_456919 [Monoraphidium minutum]|nr:MAG: hypothetical protein J3K34DRAFT_456919 [Monoraphidium minutum]
MARAAPIAALVLAALVASAAAQPLRYRIPLRTGGDDNDKGEQQQSWFRPPPALGAAPGSLIGRIFADVYKGMTNGAGGGDPVAEFVYEPAIEIAPFLDIIPIAVAPSLVLNLNPLDLAVGEAVSGSASVATSASLAPTFSVSADEPSVEIPFEGPSVTLEPATTTTTVEEGD